MRLIIRALIICTISSLSTFTDAYAVKNPAQLWYQFVENTSRNMATPVREEFEKASEEFFNQHLLPFLHETDALVANRIDDVDKRVEGRINQFNSILENAFENIKNIGTDYERFFNDIASKVEMLRINLKADIAEMFTKANYFVDCKAAGFEEKLRQDMQSIIKIFPSYWLIKPSCYSIIGIDKTPKYWEYTTVYKLNKCEKLSSLDVDSSADAILRAYIDLQALSARVGCVQSVANESAAEYFREEYLDLGLLVNLWKKTQE